MRRLSVFSLAIIIVASTVDAADTGSSSAADVALTDARAAIKIKDYAKAESELTMVVRADPDSADAWNLLGLTTRKQGRFDEAEKHYGKALALDDEHTGALEYLGMLYVETGRVDEAKVMLKRIDDACFFECDEQVRLAEAITTLKTY